jgi:hypothetical protein
VKQFREGYMPMPSESDDQRAACNNLDMDKIGYHLDGEPVKILAFKRQRPRLYPNAYKGPLVSSTSNRRQGSSRPNKTRNVNSRMIGLVPISPNTDQLRISDVKRLLQASIAAYANQRASPKMYGQANTPETVRTTPILP